VVDGGAVPSAADEACEPGLGSGSELCGWDLRVGTSGAVEILGFAPSGDVVWGLGTQGLGAARLPGEPNLGAGRTASAERGKGEGAMPGSDGFRCAR
jgi:hypothetical protein